MHNCTDNKPYVISFLIVVLQSYINFAMSEPTLKIVSPSDVSTMTFDPVDPLARDQASDILKTVKDKRLDGLIEVAVRLKDIETKDSKLFYTLQGKYLS